MCENEIKNWIELINNQPWVKLENEKNGIIFYLVSQCKITATKFLLLLVIYCLFFVFTVSLNYFLVYIVYYCFVVIVLFFIIYCFVFIVYYCFVIVYFFAFYCFRRSWRGSTSTTSWGWALWRPGRTSRPSYQGIWGQRVSGCVWVLNVLGV